VRYVSREDEKRRDGHEEADARHNAEDGAPGVAAVSGDTI
jgi:hypothetical protein